MKRQLVTVALCLVGGILLTLALAIGPKTPTSLLPKHTTCGAHRR